ncbi:hypothetical protein Ptr902_13137 [Pyrenophora tritici-repentis]|nr:hypothetical protein Ptr902_13137 [Pyrenophora tritici-repentis]
MELQVQANADLRLQETAHRQEKRAIKEKAREDGAKPDLHGSEDDTLPKMPVRQAHPADKKTHNDPAHHGPVVAHGNSQPQGHPGLSPGSFPQGGYIRHFHPVGYPGYGPPMGHPGPAPRGEPPNSETKKQSKGKNLKSKKGAKKAEEGSDEDTGDEQPVASSGGANRNKHEALHEAVSKSQRGMKSTTTVSKIKVPGASIHIKRTKVSDSSKTKESRRHRTRNVNESSQPKVPHSEASNQLSVEAAPDSHDRSHGEVKHERKRDFKHDEHSEVKHEEVKHEKKKEVKFEEHSEVKHETKQHTSSGVRVSQSRSTIGVDATSHPKPPVSDHPHESAAVGNSKAQAVISDHTDINTSHSSSSNTKASQAHKTVAIDTSHPKPQDAAKIDGLAANHTPESNVQAAHHVKTKAEQSSKSKSSSWLSKTYGVKANDKLNQQSPGDQNPSPAAASHTPASHPADTDNLPRHTGAENMQNSSSGKSGSSNTHPIPGNRDAKTAPTSTRKLEADASNPSHSNLKVDHMRSTSRTTGTEHTHSSSSTRGANTTQPTSGELTL